MKTETFSELSVFSVHLKYIMGSCNCISTTNISYAYDALGQLIRVNDETDTTSGAAGTTWTYEYDRGGNIISKSRYAYTTGPLGTALETIVYGYGDADWMDKLTHYNYIGISYDSIGNPTSYNGWHYTWEKGRQLTKMTDNVVDTITFKYNADGLRIQKRKVTTYGLDVTTNYILHGKNIVHMTQGTNVLHFWYDAQGRPAIVEYNGVKYAYIHNLQGDIVGIIDSNGNEVVQYTYDAWGKVLSTAGTMASTLGTIQPFRYRGYVYDVETGLYYLRSRYYDPVWGRFINADALVKGNLFAYCENKPEKLIDSNGNMSSSYYGFIWRDTVLFNENYGFITKLNYGTKYEVLSAYASKGSYHIRYENEDGEIVEEFAPAENIILWFGDDPESIDYFCDIYFGDFFDNTNDKPHFLRKNNSYHRKNAALSVLLNRYDELHDNGERSHWHTIVDGDYDFNLEEAVKRMQGGLGISQDGIFGKESFNAVVTFLKRLYNNCNH